MTTRKKIAKKSRRVRATTGVRRPAQPFAQHAFEARPEFLNGGGIPTIFMTREVYSRMWHLVDIADEEVGWLGAVRTTPQNDYLIEEVFLLEQEVSATATDLSVDGQAKLAQYLIDNRADGIEIVNRLRFWGHSHVTMETSPSPQDDRQMEQFLENGCSWFVRGILNKRGRMEFTLFLWEARVKIVDVPWAIYERVDESIRSEIEAEFRNKVSRKIYIPPVGVVVYQPWTEYPSNLGNGYGARFIRDSNDDDDTGDKGFGYGG